MSHACCASPAVCSNGIEFEYFPPRLKLFFFSLLSLPPLPFATALSRSTGQVWVWCRWTCGRCARRWSALFSGPRRRKDAELRGAESESWMLKDCSSGRSGWSQLVSMRVPLSVLYPVLSLTIFGLYPSLVSGSFNNLMLEQRLGARDWRCVVSLREEALVYAKLHCKVPAVSCCLSCRFWCRYVR